MTLLLLLSCPSRDKEPITYRYKLLTNSHSRLKKKKKWSQIFFMFLVNIRFNQYEESIPHLFTSVSICNNEENNVLNMNLITFYFHNSYTPTVPHISETIVKLNYRTRKKSLTGITFLITTVIQQQRIYLFSLDTFVYNVY